MALRGFSLMRCPDCGLLFNPRPISQSDLKAMYDKSYYDPWGGEAFQKAVDLQKTSYFLWHMKIIKEHIKEGRSLDLGCAKGSFVKLALREGFDAHGLDISEYSAKAAREEIPEERIFIGRIEEQPLESQSFDLITMFDFIEHLDDIEGAIKKVSDLLRSSGLLYIVTPDTSSLSFRLLGKKWPHLKLEHLYYFNRKNLATLLEHFSLRTIKTGPCLKTLSVRYIIEQFKAYPAVPFTQIAKAANSLLPDRMLDLFVSIYSGEFVLVAKKH
jgi:2-polyprenyl-3-methyl-5-hydroxy-6-metoxy-1,4-benzoquinol methylase